MKTVEIEKVQLCCYALELALWSPLHPAKKLFSILVIWNFWLSFGAAVPLFSSFFVLVKAYILFAIHIPHPIKTKSIHSSSTTELDAIAQHNTTIQQFTWK